MDLVIPTFHAKQIHCRKKKEMLYRFSAHNQRVALAVQTGRYNIGGGMTNGVPTCGYYPQAMHVDSQIRMLVCWAASQTL